MQLDFYHDAKRDFLIYPPHVGDDKLLAGIRDAKRLGNQFIAVPRSLYNCQWLRWVDLPVPPIMDGYDWPHNPDTVPAGSKVPTDAQRTMANFLALHARSFNLSDMGTMKTLAALWAADYIMQQYPQGECRCLINAPLSILQRVWGDAIFNHLLGRRTFQIVHHYNAEKRREQLAKPADFYIINPDGLKVGAKLRHKGRPALIPGGLSLDLLQRRDIKIGIVDEAGVYRDRRTGRHRVARLLYDPSRMPYLWLLTGTPTPNAPTDAYGLAKLVNDAYGESFTDFHRRTMVQVPHSQFKWVPARGSYQAAGRLLQPAVRFAIEDVWDGPPLTIQQRQVELTQQQHHLLSDLKRNASILIAGREITPANEAVVRAKALQIIQGGIYDHDHNSINVDASPRINELLKCIDEATRKTLVFVPLTNIVNLLCQKLEEAGYDKALGRHIWKTIKLNGEVSAKHRSESIAAYKSDDVIRAAVADPTVVAHGINEFVAATTVVWYAPTDKAELWAQGNKRAHRPGQTFPVTIVQIVATALEKEIFRRLVHNESLQGTMLKWIQNDEL